MHDPYEVLGVAHDASPEEIKTAFRKLAMENHPDRHGGSDEAKARFQEINSAYETLTKPQAQTRRPQDEAPFSNFDFVFQEMFGQGHPHADIFREMFRQQGFRRGNPDVHTQIELTLEQAFMGGEVEVKVPRKAGVETFRVHVPRSIRAGQRIRVPRGGMTDDPNLPPGDAYVHVNVRPHPQFEVHGETLVTHVEINAFEAMLGTRAGLMGIDGRRVEFDINPGTQFGAQITVPGEGMYLLNSQQRADLVILVKVTVPTAITAEHAEFIARLSEKLPNAKPTR